MDKFTYRLVLLPLLATLLPLPVAATDNTRMYGKSAPFTLTDLPQDSHLRKQLDALPDNIKRQALKRLHKFSFPANDTAHLNVSPNGYIFYNDPALPRRPASAKPQRLKAPASAASALPTVDVFKLHTRPGSKNQVFLDFDGMTLSDTEWNYVVGKSVLSARPFDLDGDEARFNGEEQYAIMEIWHRMAEDYAPFDIDVTTEDPVFFTSTSAHVLFTRNRDANGYFMPASGAGGVAFVDVWKGAEYINIYSPALVYYNNLGDSESNLMAEAGSHEFGHNLGLTHDGSPRREYFLGIGSGLVSWAPIMGAGYYNQVTQWSKGEYAGANNQQDDVAIITRHLGAKPDDHGNDFGNASQLLFDSDGYIRVTTPDIDPDNTEPDNKGVIGTRSDVDMFFFDTTGNAIHLMIDPAWAAFYRDENRGANLDIKATLFDSNGVEIKSDDPTDETSAAIHTNLGAGRYYLAIEGVGNAITPYSDYNSAGEYFISGNLTDADTQAPAPDPMTWDQSPSVLPNNSITMTASVASDNVSAVEYQFVCSGDVVGCVTSNWQSSPGYIVQNVGSGTYRFAVKARDMLGNETALSEERSVSPNTPIAVDDQATVAEDGTASVMVLSNDSETSGNKLSISQFSQGISGKVVKKSAGLQYKPNKDFNGSDSFTYTAKSPRGGTATATVSVTVTPVNDVPKAKNDSVTVIAGNSITIDLLGNDSDVDGDVLSITSVSPGKKGTVSLNGGSIDYQAGLVAGTDKLNYVVSDGHGGTAKAVVTVTVKKG
ncbi:MAG: cadherin-like domain-containing protein [Methylococcales bacterium]|nr:cadherin-like domain-containing protein [Methylococcales bacterium]